MGAEPGRETSRTFTICCATIIGTGSEDQKRHHISAALWGDSWIVNGAKTWSTGAFAADYGLLLARTNWDVPKHEGLTMFLVRLNSPGITLRRITQVNGSTEFCEEFFDDFELSDADVVGEVDKGWDVASRQLYHERRAVGGGSEFARGSGAENDQEQAPDYHAMLNAAGLSDSERAREAAGRALTRRAVWEQLGAQRDWRTHPRVSRGNWPPTAACRSIRSSTAAAEPSHVLSGQSDLPASERQLTQSCHWQPCCR